MNDDIVDALGSEIVSGTLQAGTSMRLEDLSERFSVSRTVARDAARELESLGLLASKRRTGLSVLGMASWSVFHPKIIGWRMATERRASQLVSLSELRLGIEPVAAELAATRRTSAQALEIVRLSRRIRELGMSVDDRFSDADSDFHLLILEASGNEMYAALSASLEAVLKARAHQGLMPSDPVIESFDLHQAVAEAIERRDPAGAESSMRALLRQNLAEVEGTTGLSS